MIIRSLYSVFVSRYAFLSSISVVLFIISVFFPADAVFPAPPFPGVWKKTRMGFKSEKDFMYVSPESFVQRPSIKLKSEGQLKCIVLLAEYQDKKFNVKIESNQYNPKDYFGELIFGSLETNKYYKFPSFKDYWEINSGGKLIVSGNIYGPYTLSSTLSDYSCGSKNGSGRYCGLGRGTDELVGELVRLADGEVDFSQFDSDKDGSVDCFMVIHSGKGGEVQEYSLSSPNCCDIWSHAFSTYISTSDGVNIRGGVIAAGISEIFPYGNMGLIAHEFGHILGLPDLYDTGSSGLVSCGVGPYSLMAYGLYKGPRGALGTLPSNLSPWEKIYLGWATSTLVIGQYCDKVSSTSYSPFFLKIPAYSDPNSKEYFLIDFRKRENFDSDFPVDGVLIWHIDEQIVRQRLGSNSINTDECYPGCGNICGEVKDREGRFLTCDKHYGIAIIPTSAKSDPWILQKTNINEDSLPCLIPDSQDFWVKGKKFPDSYTSAFGYKGVEHNVLVIIYADELNQINIAATTESSKMVLKGPSLREGERYDWVALGQDYIARVRIEGTAPLLIRSIFPPDSFLKVGDIVGKEIYISSEKGYVDQELEFIWKAPLNEMSQGVTVLAENCVERVIEQWSVKVQDPKTTLDSNPTNPDGSAQPFGCACKSSGGAGVLSSIFVFVFLILYLRVRKIKLCRE
ncbi:MAG: M6 family metalloprotease domain-containing protein [bacterium]|nr:M6 family metalloprotease domain-containing protein [bacterium]